jgi:hypothetical protein
MSVLARVAATVVAGALFLAPFVFAWDPPPPSPTPTTTVPTSTTEMFPWPPP